MPTIASHTLGCKVNQTDTEAMVESFERAGYTLTTMDREADVYLINTCTVTGTGDQKSLKLIRRIHREHPSADIIVAGCLAQRDAQSVALPGVALVIGVARRAQVVELYQTACKAPTARPLVAVGSLKDAPFEMLYVSKHEGKTRATMKIQEGCDRFCAYCVIPYVRGPVRSMPLPLVVEEATRLANAGYVEIVLTGICLAAYGTDDYGLLDAVRAVANVPGVRRVRLGSLEPTLITERFAQEAAAIPALCHQFHLSMQSGSASVLQRMRRRYTPDDYETACRRLRANMPCCAITTDVLTGFPGETHVEAQETLDFVKKIAFARIHVFPYSRRSGTLADRMPNQVPEAIKKIRVAELGQLGNQLEAAYVYSLQGTQTQVLFERSTSDGMCEGCTPEYVRVRAPGVPGTLRDVVIDRVDGPLAYGHLLEDSEASDTPVT